MDSTDVSRDMKTIFYFIVLILFLWMLTGCVDGRRVSNFSEGAVVVGVETHYDICWYYTNTTSGDGIVSNGRFADKCGRFTVGDTIVLTKIQ